MYIAGVVGSLISMMFIIFAIASLGYLLGSIEIRGISLGTAGVLVVALLYGILASHIPSFQIGEREIALFSSSMNSSFSLVSNLGTSMFISAVGLIAGPKFFRSFNRSSMSYLLMGLIAIAAGALITVVFILIDQDLSPSMAVGLMTGALTSTPGLSAAKEVSQEADLVTAGYGIAYIFGVLGVVFFVQLMPKLLKTDMEEERKRFIAANRVEVKEISRVLRQVEAFSFFPFFLTITLGCIIGAFYIPGINFSLGSSGGCLVAGLIVGHFGHLGPIDLRVEKESQNFYRELGLVLFLIGAGVPGGVNFMNNVKITYFLYGVAVTLFPMVIGYLFAKYLFRLDLLNTLGSITGGMTSTPALGALIHAAKTDEVAAAYAATYPVALVCVVLAAKIIILVM